MPMTSLCLAWLLLSGGAVPQTPALPEGARGALPAEAQRLLGVPSRFTKIEAEDTRLGLVDSAGFWVAGERGKMSAPLPLAGPVELLRFSNNGERVALYAGGQLHRLNTRSGQELGPALRTQRPDAMAWSGATLRLVSQGQAWILEEDGALRPSETSTELLLFYNSDNYHNISASPDGTHWAMVEQQEGATVLVLRSWEGKDRMRRNQDRPVESLALGQERLARVDRLELRVWSVDSGEVLGAPRLPRARGAVSFDSSVTWAAWSEDSASVDLLDLRTPDKAPKRLLLPPSLRGRAWTLSPEGALLFPGEPGRVLLLRPSALAEQPTLEERVLLAQAQALLPTRGGWLVQDEAGGLRSLSPEGAVLSLSPPGATPLLLSPQGLQAELREGRVWVSDAQDQALWSASAPRIDHLRWADDGLSLLCWSSAAPQALLRLDAASGAPVPGAWPSPAEGAFALWGERVAGISGAQLTLNGRSMGERAELLLFSADGSTLAAAGASGLRLFDSGGEPTLSLPLSTPSARLALAPDGAWVALAGADGRVRVWSARGVLLLDQSFPGGVGALAPSGDGAALGVLTADGVFALTLPSGPPPPLIFPERGLKPAGPGLAVDPQGRLATVDSAGVIQSWLSGPALPEVPFVRSADGLTLAQADPSGGVRLWSLAEGRALPSIPAQAPTQALLSPDGARVLVSDPQGRRLYDTRSGQALAQLGTVALRAWDAHPSNGFFAQVEADPKDPSLSRLTVWDASGRRVQSLGIQAPINGIVLTPDGRGAILLQNTGELTWWTFKQDLLTPLPVPRRALTRWERIGDELLLGGADGRIDALNLSSGALRLSLSGHDGPVQSFTVEGTRLTVTHGARELYSEGARGLERIDHNTGAVLVWDLERGELLQRWPLLSPGLVLQATQPQGRFPMALLGPEPPPDPDRVIAAHGERALASVTQSGRVDLFEQGQLIAQTQVPAKDLRVSEDGAELALRAQEDLLWRPSADTLIPCPPDSALCASLNEADPGLARWSGDQVWLEGGSWRARAGDGGQWARVEQSQWTWATGTPAWSVDGALPQALLPEGPRPTLRAEAQPTPVKALSAPTRVSVTVWSEGAPATHVRLRALDLPEGLNLTPGPGLSLLPAGQSASLWVELSGAVIPRSITLELLADGVPPQPIVLRLRPEEAPVAVTRARLRGSALRVQLRVPEGVEAGSLYWMDPRGDWASQALLLSPDAKGRCTLELSLPEGDWEALRLELAVGEQTLQVDLGRVLE